MLQDPDIRQAAVEQPISSRDQSLAELFENHNVNILSESLGAWDLVSEIQLLDAAGCPTDLELMNTFKAKFALIGALTAKRMQFLDGIRPARTNVLTIKSAGNEATVTDSPADLIDCGERSDHEILIGALDINRRLADFSNSGSCVDAFAHGSNVVLASALGFQQYSSGTSFSTPLVARWLSKTAPGYRSRLGKYNLCHMRPEIA